MATSFVLMLGDKVRAVFTSTANNGDPRKAAGDLAGSIANQSVDDGQNIAKQNAAWIAEVEENPLT